MVSTASIWSQELSLTVCATGHVPEASQLVILRGLECPLFKRLVSFLLLQIACLCHFYLPPFFTFSFLRKVNRSLTYQSLQIFARGSLRRKPVFNKHLRRVPVGWSCATESLLRKLFRNFSGTRGLVFVLATLPHIITLDKLMEVSGLRDI